MKPIFGCPSCGKNCHIGQKSCAHCGYIFEYICQECNGIVEFDAVNCPHCGQVAGKELSESYEYKEPRLSIHIGYWIAGALFAVSAIGALFIGGYGTFIIQIFIAVGILIFGYIRARKKLAETERLSVEAKSDSEKVQT
jgi:predicted amidophosphoribosyltransferase